jgi:hypothetical protein
MHWGATREKKKNVRLYKREKVNNEPGIMDIGLSSCMLGPLFNGRRIANNHLVLASASS